MTATRSNSSRERILSTAEAIILENGYAGTTIEEIIEKAAITKSGFFYHFAGKMELARALIERYIVMDTEVFDELGNRADSLSEDPLQRLLIFLNLFGEMIAGMTDLHPGCLAAAFTYESQQFDEAIRERISTGMLGWREIIAKRLEEIVAKYPPDRELNIESLADMFSSTIEGGILLARIHNKNQIIIDQVQNYRTHLRYLFDDID
ncbi:MAG: TetR family transcriptional regulator [Pseudohongiella sp.]|nr:MAG: TetR family transcriptional regulator [Pseudohongiella sp.]